MFLILLMQGANMKIISVVANGVAVPCTALTMMLHTEGHCRDFELIPSSLKIKYTTGRFESTLLSLSDGTKSLRRNS